MYEPTQRRVIDFYAELVLPFLRLPDGDQRALFRSLGLHAADDVNAIDDRLERLGSNSDDMVNSVFVGSDGGRGLRARFARPDRRLTPTTIGEYWLFFGRSDLPPELDRFRAIGLRYLPPEITASLLKHATGERVWAELVRLLPRARSLNGNAGTILLQPQTPLYLGPEAQVAEFRLLAPPLRVPYLLGETVLLFSGQQVVGSNGLRPKDATYASFRSLPFGLPLILAFRTLPESAPDEESLSPVTLFRARASSTAAERIQLRGLTIADISALVELVPSEAILDEALAPEDREANRQALWAHLVLLRWLSTWVVVDFSGFIAPRQCHVDRIYIRALGQGVRIQGRLHWVDASNLQVETTMVLDQATTDSTIWASHPPSMWLDGVSNQAWFGAIEPGVPLREGALEHHGVELRGVGNGLVSVHMETRLQGGGDVKALPSPDFHFSTVRIRGGSSFCHLGTTYMTRANFPVQVEADAAAHLVRQPVAGSNMTQPEFAAGLLNHLVNAAFPGGSGWEPSPPGVVHRRDNDIRHALSASLRVEMPQAVNLNPLEALTQTIEPDARTQVSTVADRTFAAGIWVLSEKSGVVIELRSPPAIVTNPFAFQPRSFRSRSNPHPGGLKWVFLSVLVHTPLDARRLQFAVLAPSGTNFHLSEPIVVAGAYIPPFSARVTATSGEVAGEMMPAAPADLRPIHWPGAIPGTGGPIGRSHIEADSILEGVLVAVRRQAAGVHLHLRLKTEGARGELSWLPVDSPITLIANDDGPQTLHYRFPEAPFLRTGDRLSVVVALAEGRSAGPVAKDLAVTLRLRRSI